MTGWLRNLGPDSDRPIAGAALLFLTVGLCYAGGATTTFLWFNALGEIAVFFPPAGVTLAALVLTPVRLWPVVLAAAATAEVVVDGVHDISLDTSLGYALANTVEPLLGATLLRRFAPKPDLGRLTQLLTFFACAVVAAPAVGAVIAATNNQFDGGTDWGDFWLSWFIGDGLGVLVVGSAAIAVAARVDGFRAGDISWRRAALVPLTMIVFGAVFWFEELPLIFPGIALLAWTAFAAGTVGVAVAGFGMAFAVAHATAYGHDFFDTVGVAPETGVIYLQVALAFLIGGALAIAAAVSERDYSMRAFGRSEEERRRAEALLDRTELLQRMTTEMAGALTSDAVGEVVTREAVQGLGARSAMLIVGDEEGQPSIAGQSGYNEADLAALRESVDAGENLPVVSALRTGAVTSYESRREGGSRFKSLRELSEPPAAGLAVPLLHEGATVGALGWDFEWEGPISRDMRVLAQAMALQCALALERARLSEVEHRFAREVQSVMLPSAGRLPESVDVMTYYRPSERHLEVGGDWYDVTLVNERELVVTVGDVVGRGLEASAAMGQLRSAASALARATAGPAEVLTGLDRFAGDIDAATFSTVCCARFDSATGMLRYSVAGHPPPLLVSADGYSLLEGGRSLPLSLMPKPRPEAATTVPPGALVAFYTDGLVERRTERIDAGIDRVGRVLRSVLADDRDPVIESIVAETLGERTADDDVALVLLRRVTRAVERPADETRPIASGP
jgi:serine phosphatase RsbU (regulator of sigma subunit)/integral membrane sensor domain MASE1